MSNILSLQRFKVILRVLYQTLDLTSLEYIYRYPEMLRLFYTVWYNTMVDESRLKTLFKLVRLIDKQKIEGSIVECGVYKGGSAGVMAYAAKKSLLNRDIWLFDSFEGLPNPTKKDGADAKKQYYKGFCKGDVKDVRKIFAKLDIDPRRMHIKKGWFKDTFKNNNIPKIAILHIDADWYDSVALCLDKFYANVSKGGYIVLDDYACWEGCKRATSDFIKRKRLKIEWVHGGSTSYYFQKSDV